MEDDFADFDPADYHADGRPKRRPKGDYEVGYAKPPVGTQWPKGVSGNAKGKRRGVRNYATELAEEMAELLTVESTDGRQRKITKLRANIKSIANKGAKGNVAASREIIHQYRTTFGDGTNTEGPRKLSANDQIIIDQFLSGASQTVPLLPMPDAVEAASRIGNDGEEHF
jgi:Family of unknown function (DUF5681)